MATETVSAFTPVSLNFNKDAISSYALKCENDLNFDDHATVADLNSPIAQSYYKRMSEMAGRELLSKQRDQLQETQQQHQQQQRLVERKRQEYVKLENIKTEINRHENNHTNGNNTPNHLEKQEEDTNNGKKKRNTKKRNRSDMPPEELMRLRERERKAQQSRRDRIRAQKVINCYPILLFNYYFYLITTTNQESSILNTITKAKVSVIVVKIALFY